MSKSASRKAAAGEIRTIDEEWEAVAKALEGRRTSPMRGPRSGFDLLDAKMRGVHGVSVLGGKPGVGKTTFALQLATQAAELDGTAVLWAGPEMHPDDIIERIAFRMRYEQENPDLESVERRFKQVGAGFAINGEGRDFQEFYAAMQQLKAKSDASSGLLVVDSLQAMTLHAGAAETDSMKLSIDRVLSETYRAAYAGGFAVLFISHVPKGVEEPRGAFGFSGSGGIDYLVDSTLQLVDAGPSGGKGARGKVGEEKVERELHLIKNRFGRPGTIHFDFYPAEHRFEEQR